MMKCDIFDCAIWHCYQPFRNSISTLVKKRAMYSDILTWATVAPSPFIEINMLDVYMERFHDYAVTLYYRVMISLVMF